MTTIGPRRCRHCGCVEAIACVTDRGTCGWATEDECSACVGPGTRLKWTHPPRELTDAYVDGWIDRSGRKAVTSAYWSEETDCWFVPVSSGLFDRETLVVESARIELKEGQLVITDRTRPQELKLVIPAPRFDRWWESRIANMVGREATIDGWQGTIVFAAPVDGSPEEGASAVQLTVRVQ